jgi:hypothetical protein
MWEWQGDWTVKDKSDGDGWQHALSLDALCVRLLLPLFLSYFHRRRSVIMPSCRWSGTKCQPAKALVRARKWTRIITTRRFNLAAGARVVADEQMK